MACVPNAMKDTEDRVRVVVIAVVGSDLCSARIGKYNCGECASLVGAAFILIGFILLVVVLAGYVIYLAWIT